MCLKSFKFLSKTGFNSYTMLKKKMMLVLVFFIMDEFHHLPQHSKFHEVGQYSPIIKNTMTKIISKYSTRIELSRVKYINLQCVCVCVCVLFIRVFWSQGMWMCKSGCRKVEGTRWLSWMPNLRIKSFLKRQH